MEVIILGTSSATPTLRRGLSGTVLMREGETFLFDCGEGTQFRLMQAEIPRRKFHHIFITHLHGDHIFGLGGLISTLNLGKREIPLHVHGPKGIARFVEFMVNFPRPTRLGFSLECHEYPRNHRGVIAESKEWVVTSRPLDHGMPTLGYRFQEKDRPGRFDEERATEMGVPFGPLRGHLIRGEDITLEDGRVVRASDIVGPPRPGRSFAYCTDTAYSEEARLLAEDADLILHEATFCDEDEDMARDRKHSTIRQAAMTARDAGARRFVATHFSTRYDGPAMKRLEKEGREVVPDLIMARDLTRIAIPFREIAGAGDGDGDGDGEA